MPKPSNELGKQNAQACWYSRVSVASSTRPRLRTPSRPLGVSPEKPPFHPGGRDDLPLIAFVADPDGYEIEIWFE